MGKIMHLAFETVKEGTGITKALGIEPKNQENEKAFQQLRPGSDLEFSEVITDELRTAR